jgi:hypothetical protein
LAPAWEENGTGYLGVEAGDPFVGSDAGILETISYWNCLANAGSGRGVVDTNCTRTDLSVTRLNSVQRGIWTNQPGQGDERFLPVPEHNNAQNADWAQALPAR